MNGILLIGKDEKISARAKSKNFKISIADDYSIPFEKTLICEAGTRIPWDLLPAAWNFLNRWDAAVPLWKYGVTAQDVGSDQDRKITRDITLDLRILLYSHELLFVRNNPAGNELIDQWKHEIQITGEKRLAFLRAFYLIKPRLCVLPISWMAEIREKSKQNQIRRNARTISGGGGNLVRVEVAPGRFVKCKAGDEERVKNYYSENQKTR